MIKHSVIAITTLMAVGSACAESSVSLYGEIDTGYQFGNGNPVGDGVCDGAGEPREHRSQIPPGGGPAGR